MPGRQSHRPARNGQHAGTKESRVGYLPLQPVDAPAPSAPSAPQWADDATREAAAEPGPLGTAAASTIAEWILDHAREDLLRGQAVPAAVKAHVRELVRPSASARTDVRDDSLKAAKTMASVGQVAHTSGLSPQRLRHLAATGRITAERLDRRTWLIDPASVEEYLRRK
jgi:hypothetical protein